MKLLIDTCVLFPTVMRHPLSACKSKCGPTWSERILEEWADRRELGQRVIQARGEIIAEPII